MTWTNLTYPFESVLTSTKMSQNQSNFPALAEGHAGAPPVRLGTSPMLAALGDGRDGTAGATKTWDTSTAIPPGVYEYRNMTINTGVAITLNGSYSDMLVFRVKGTLTLADSASISVKGAGGVAGVGVTDAGGTAGSNGRWGGKGGKGETDNAGAGGAGGTTWADSAGSDFLRQNEFAQRAVFETMDPLVESNRFIFGGAGGGGGGQDSGSPGGDGGAGGGTLIIIADVIVVGLSDVHFEAAGEDGADDADGGGGGGGGGGIVVTCARSYSGTPTISTSGGALGVGAATSDNDSEDGAPGWTMQVTLTTSYDLGA